MPIPTLVNGGFSTPDVAGWYANYPSGATWYWVSPPATAGITGQSTIPQYDVQCMYLNQLGAAYQDFASDGTPARLRFVAKRSAAGAATLRVTVGGAVVFEQALTTAWTAYSTADLTLAPGTLTLAFAWSSGAASSQITVDDVAFAPAAGVLARVQQHRRRIGAF